MDSQKAEGLEFSINLVTPDNGEQFLIELQNATLTNIQGYLSEDPSLALTLNRVDLERVMTGEATFEGLISEGALNVDGDLGVLSQLAETMVEFTPNFEIFPGTLERKTSASEQEAFKAETGRLIPE
jgi:linear primary-alkylsulfatase